jgi:hypothetical protein
MWTLSERAQRSHLGVPKRSFEAKVELQGRYQLTLLRDAGRERKVSHFGFGDL